MSFLSVNKSISIRFPSSLSLRTFFNFSISIVNFFVLLYCFFLYMISYLFIFCGSSCHSLFKFCSSLILSSVQFVFFFCLVFWNELSLFIFHFKSIHYFFLSTSISFCLFLFLYLSKYKIKQRNL